MRIPCMEASFIPPFCPNPGCAHHLQGTHARAPDPGTADQPFWKRHGAYHTSRDGWIPRFRCRICGRTFGEPAFRLWYYAKKPLDLGQIFRSLSAGESLASIGRHLACRPESIQNRLERLGRASLALQARLTGRLSYSEDLVADGFEAFERSQFFPSHLNILVGADSQFLYGMTHVTLRRKGRMTDAQKRRRAAIEQRFRPPPGAQVRAFLNLIRQIPRHWDHSRRPSLTLRTDEHQAYPKALSRLPALVESLHDGCFHHATYASTLPRTTANPLFPVNYHDRELRKDIAGFRRETTCVIRNVGSGCLRTSCHMAWHNFQKPHRVRGEHSGRTRPTHAEMAGIPTERIQTCLTRLFIDRPFPARDPLPDWAVAIWMRRYPTPLAVRPDYVPKFWLVDPQQASGF